MVGRVFLVFSVIAIVIPVLSMGLVVIAGLSAKNGRDALAAVPALGIFIYSMTAWLWLATISYALRGLDMVIELLAAKV